MDTAICQGCDTEYERYTIFWTDDTDTLHKRDEVRTIKGLDKLCPDCLKAEMDPHLAFAIDE